mmetsp:Transcript_19440/g.23253  ORF Transcript_19440/g.23253 Transcript_19440/m.23253 type:complete len:193 (+) Transcript_19440:229-807(+)|eukprot:CAMPEP_0197852604 /NCGR_PEP_ID=MMETSP1438-20131217/21052_1 /TAXON_ID=1461541 /ORGANISM="Pterosperma sp., Strain CCMP1384" /LENGTH=192 /DNA_ID=CAMNT_0043466743 /DNA_START=217 /DNA_END=795 /DNA_ORIENTATION=-
MLTKTVALLFLLFAPTVLSAPGGSVPGIRKAFLAFEMVQVRCPRQVGKAGHQIDAMCGGCIGLRKLSMPEDYSLKRRLLDFGSSLVQAVDDSEEYTAKEFGLPRRLLGLTAHKGYGTFAAKSRSALDTNYMCSEALPVVDSICVGAADDLGPQALRSWIEGMGCQDAAVALWYDNGNGVQDTGNALARFASG